MAQDILSGAQVRSSYALALIDVNRGESSLPVSRLDLRDSIRACLQLREYVTEACLEAWKETFANQVSDYNTTGILCLLTFDVALRTLRAVRRVLDTALEDGRLGDLDSYLEEEVAKFRETIPALEHARADFEARWPWFDEARLLESQAADRRGEPRKVTREAFREVRSRIQGTSH
jgi:hypothetical protein